MTSDIEILKEEIRNFCEERKWIQFHNGKDLATAISIEASELQEAFLWKSAELASNDKIQEELADVFIYALRMADVYKLDVREIIHNKLTINALKYPVDKCSGISTKYTDL